MGRHRPYRKRANSVGYDKRGGSVLAEHVARSSVGSHFMVVSVVRFGGVFGCLVDFGPEERASPNERESELNAA